MNSMTTAISLSAILSLSGIASVSAQPKPGQAAAPGNSIKPMPMRFQMAPPDPLDIFRRCGINKEQEARLAKLHKEFTAWRQGKISQLEACGKKQRDLFLQADPDEKLLIATQEEMNKINGEIAMGRLKRFQMLRGVLTEAQRKKLVAMMKETAGGAGGARMAVTNPARAVQPTNAAATPGAPKPPTAKH